MTHTQRHQCDQQGVGATGHANAMFDRDKSGQGGFKVGNLWTKNVLTLLHNLLNSPIQDRFDTVLLGLKVNERNWWPGHLRIHPLGRSIEAL